MNTQNPEIILMANAINPNNFKDIFKYNFFSIIINHALHFKVN
jgi:hypothetical protein